ncbi:MAG TPA: hypothetical protein VFR49_13685 [Solirubrobacteraceae bacterium]|nr:hypothetical protein [Solirubrobacteraceae bacterium]
MFTKARGPDGVPESGPPGRPGGRSRWRRGLRLRSARPPAGLASGEALPGFAGTTVESIDAGRGRYDHVIVGPRGVFLLDRRSPGGEIEIRDGVPWLRGERSRAPDRPIDIFRRRALADAAAVSAELRRRAGRPIWVTPVVVLWADFPAGLVETDRVVYVHGARFGSWLGSLPATLSAAEVAEIGAALTALKRDRDARRGLGRPEAQELPVRPGPVARR